MDQIEIPILPLQAPLNKAFDQMTHENRSAIVATDGENYWLIKAGHIVQAIHRGDKRLADIDHRSLVYQVSSHDLKKRRIDRLDLFKSGNAVENLLDRVARSYAFFAVPPGGAGLAQLITRQEKFAAEISIGPRICYCLNPHHPHGFDPPVPKVCDRCNSKIVCK